MGIFKPTILKAHVKYKGHDIIFRNSWQMLPFKSKETLEVDGVVKASSSKMEHLNPHEPIFSLNKVAPDLESIDVFLIGVFKVKASIVVNGEVLHQDEIDAFDKIQAKVFDS